MQVAYSTLMSDETQLGGDLVRDAYEAGRKSWPGITLTLPAFAARAQALGVEGHALTAHGADLLLAVACVERDEAAIAHFEAAYMTEVERYVARFALSPADLDEVRQQVRLRMLAGPEPKLALYTAAGPLGAWLRVASLRVALNYLDGRNLEQARAGDAERLADRLVEGASPELEATRKLHRPQLKAALERSLAGLSPREKALLKMHFFDELGIDAIGAVYRVHRATAARWLVALRRRLVDDIRRDLALDLGASPTEMRSLVEALREDIRLSVSRVLR